MRAVALPDREGAAGQDRGRTARPAVDPDPIGPDPEPDQRTGRYRALLEVTERLSTSFDRRALEQTVIDAAASLSGADIVLLRVARGDLLELVA